MKFWSVHAPPRRECSAPTMLEFGSHDDVHHLISLLRVHTDASHSTHPPQLSLLFWTHSSFETLNSVSQNCILCTVYFPINTQYHLLGSRKVYRGEYNMGISWCILITMRACIGGQEVGIVIISHDWTSIARSSGGGAFWHWMYSNCHKKLNKGTFYIVWQSGKKIPLVYNRHNFILLTIILNSTFPCYGPFIMSSYFKVDVPLTWIFLKGNQGHWFFGPASFTWDEKPFLPSAHFEEP